MDEQKISIRRILAAYSRRQGCVFHLHGDVLPAMEIFADEGLLPAVAIQAQAAGRRLLDADLGCSTRASAGGMIKLRAAIPDLLPGRMSDTVRALFCMHVADRIFGLSKGGDIDCTPVVDFYSVSMVERAQRLNPNERMEWPMAHRLQVQEARV